MSTARPPSAPPPTLAVDPADPGAGTQPGPERVQWRRRGLAVAALLLVPAILASLALGSNPLSLSEVVGAFVRDNGDPRVIVVEQRIPRTVLALLVGAALAVAGALMQAMTRNPLADPGLLGVGAGATFAMAMSLYLLPGASGEVQVLAAFVGAAITTVLVYAIGSVGRSASSTVTLLLAGVAVGAVLSGITQALRILDARTFLGMRVWDTGSLEERGWSVIVEVAPFILVGLVLAGLAAHGLNAVALGDDLADALGARRRVTQVLVVVAVTLLCGAATAAIGPVWFVGLMVPLITRRITGPHQIWVVAYCCLLGPLLMVTADVIGRVVVPPDEVAAGVITALIGGPVLIGLMRRGRVTGL